MLNSPFKIFLTVLKTLFEPLFYDSGIKAVVLRWWKTLCIKQWLQWDFILKIIGKKKIVRDLGTYFDVFVFSNPIFFVTYMNSILLDRRAAEIWISSITLWPCCSSISNTESPRQLGLSFASCKSLILSGADSCLCS